MDQQATAASRFVITLGSMFALGSIASAQFPGLEFSQLDGTRLGDEFGYAVSNGTDVDGDGYDDVIVGAPYEDATPGDGVEPTGMVHVYSGRTGLEFMTLSGATPGARFGSSVVGLEDIDGDGRAELLVGAPGRFQYGWGGAWVLRGSDGSELFSHDGAHVDDAFGVSVAALGDVNGDGVADYVVGADRDDTGGVLRGRVRVYSGANGALLHDIIGFYGLQSGLQLGHSVCGVDDLNEDGYADFVATAMYGAVVYSGLSGEMLVEVDALGGGMTRSCASVGDLNGDGRGDFVIGHWADETMGMRAGRATAYSYRLPACEEIFTWYGSEWGMSLGSSVASAGDFNMDGTPDVLIGGSGANSSYQSSGAAYVFSGVDGSTLWSYSGQSNSELYGLSVAGGGDMNNDGFPDITIGQPQFGESVGASRLGRVLRFSGGPDPVQSFCSAQANSTGQAAVLSMSGTASVEANAMVLQLNSVPNMPGLVFLGGERVEIPFGDGMRCVGGTLRRLPTGFAESHSLSTAVDMASGDLAELLVPGTFCNFQGWFRDPAAGGAGFNMSNGLQIHVYP